MKQYLQVHAGPYQMLLDSEGIHEILDLTDEGTSGHRDWRGRVLTSINGRVLLGMRNDTLPSVHAGVVYSGREEDIPVMLELDKVECLRQADDDSLIQLPPVPEQVFRLFDRVLPDNKLGLQLYHLRRPLDLEAMLIQAINAINSPLPPAGEGMKSENNPQEELDEDQFAGN